MYFFTVALLTVVVLSEVCRCENNEMSFNEPEFFKDDSLQEELSNFEEVTERFHKETVGIHNFKVGCALEVKYTTPATGEPVIDLKDNTSNIILQIKPNWIKRSLELNTYNGGSWGMAERPKGFDFTVGVPLAVRLEAHHNYYRILVNGKVLYNYRHRLALSSLAKVEWYNINSNAITAHLLEVSIFFKNSVQI